jgi:hypothetical protein
MRKEARFAWAVGIGVLPVLASQKPALADYRAVGGITQNAGGSFTPIDSYDHSGLTDAAGQVNYDEAPGEPNPSYHAQADSEANNGQLRAHAFSQVIKNATSASGFTFNQTASSAAYATFTDFLISGPASPATIPISLNLHLSGGHIVISTDTPGNSTRASTNAQVGVLFNDANVGAGDYFAQSSDGGDAEYTDTGMLAGFDGDATLTSPTFNAPVNTPFKIELRLSAFAGIEFYYAESFIVAANSDFGNTLSFATSGDVFNLPDDGYTINSAQAFIVDNNFVPEPATASLAMAALAGIIARRRHASARRAIPTRGAA